MVSAYTRVEIDSNHVLIGEYPTIREYDALESIEEEDEEDG